MQQTTEIDANNAEIAMPKTKYFRVINTGALFPSPIEYCGGGLWEVIATGEVFALVKETEEQPL